MCWGETMSQSLRSQRDADLLLLAHCAVLSDPYERLEDQIGSAFAQVLVFALSGGQTRRRSKQPDGLCTQRTAA